MVMNAPGHWSKPLRNSKIRLEPIHSTDFERLFAIASDPLIWEQHPDRERYQKDVFQNYFDSAVASGTAYLILDAQTDELIGCTRYYQFDPENESVAIGYTFLVRKCWGGAYNRSCKLLLLKHAFEVVKKVYFHVGSNNVRSQKAVEKLGAIKCGELESQTGGRPGINFEYVLEKHTFLQQQKSAE